MNNYRASEMQTKGYYSCMNSSFNDMVAPPKPPKDTLFTRYLLSAPPHVVDYSSPNKSRPIINYFNDNNSNSSSGGGSGSSSSCKSPLSAVEEDVLVMDGILVDSNKVSTKSTGKFRSPANSDSSSSNSAINLYKTELCMSWEKSGTCRYGSRCQFAHGKEEKRPTPKRVHNFNLDFVDPYYSPQSGMYSSCSSNFALETMATLSPAKESANSKFNKAILSRSKDAPTIIVSNPYCSPQSSIYSSGSSKFAPETMATPSPGNKATNSKISKASHIDSKFIPTVSGKIITDWSPLDDGIAVTLPFSSNEPPTREAVDEHIYSVAYGPTRNKRLPVFGDICPE